jgi:hypothetical protein
MELISQETFKKFVETYDSKKDPSDVVDAINQAISQKLFSIGRTNEVMTPGTQSYDKTTSMGIGVEPAIGTIQSLFAKSGISIAVCAEDHRYKDDPPVKPKIDPYTKGMRDAINAGDTEGWLPKDLAAAQIKIQLHAAAKQTYRTQLAWYNASMCDYKRGQSLALLSGGGEQFPKPGLTILERGMTYDPESNPVRESDIIKYGYTNKQRSALIAAYIFLSVAGGDQGADDRVLVFFGEEHLDLLEYFEYFVRNSYMIPWVNKRKRNYGIIASHVR